MKKKKYTVIDLFAGTSALSEGFINHGFIPLSHIEMDKNACDTIRTRVAFHYLKSINKLEVYYKYLRKEISRNELYTFIPDEYLDSVINKEISDSTIPGLFDQIEDSKLFKDNGSKVDFIVGGPPCQAYSMVLRHKKGIECDDRCFLYKLYGKFLAHYKPYGFVFENVVGLLSAAGGKHYKELNELFKGYGYDLYPLILQANDYGVLQKRKRLLIIGWKENTEIVIAAQIHPSLSRSSRRQKSSSNPTRAMTTFGTSTPMFIRSRA
jgi:DNA (cytosine-5)-methyltransferase 1